MNIIAKAEKIVNDYLEAIGASKSNEKVSKAVLTWYSYTDITDPYMLAALVLKFNDEYRQLTPYYIYEITAEYFPEVVYGMGNPISIEEIEMAEADMRWR